MIYISKIVCGSLKLTHNRYIYKQGNLMHLYFERVKKAGERHAIGVFFKLSLCEIMKPNL